MDLAFHFYPFTELGCSWITWLLKWFSTIHVLWISSFATLVARPLKLAAALFRKLLNIRNIFRVAFLSCSHIRLEMCSEACGAGLRRLIAALFCPARQHPICYHRTAALSTTFFIFFSNLFHKPAVPCSFSVEDPAENLLLSCRCFSAAKCILPLPKCLCKHYY